MLGYLLLIQALALDKSTFGVLWGQFQVSPGLILLVLFYINYLFALFFETALHVAQTGLQVPM